MADVRGRIWKPKTKLNTHEWCAKYVRLDKRFTARPGMYDVNFTPYMKGPHEWFSDPYVEEITGAKSRQVGGTTYLGNCMMFAAAEDPGPGLYVTSTIAKAQSFSEREWQPRVELCEPLKELMPDDDHDFKKLVQHFKSCTFELTGSNSPANLMSRPIRYLFEDEVDTWPEGDEGDAPAMSTAEASTISYSHARKILRISTPTVPEGNIWKYFLRGTQHKYFVPCPVCGHEFELKFEHLNFHRETNRNAEGKWDLDKVRDTTSLTCPSKGCDVEQWRQGQMVVDGKWVQTNPNAPRRHISWHISALYSPTLTWGQIAVIFLEGKDTAGGIHDFYNHYLGLPYVAHATIITISDVERVRDASPKYKVYDERDPNWTLPAEMEFILMMVDVQQDCFWWGQRGVSINEDSYLIDYGQAATWADLAELRERWYRQPSGEMTQPFRGLIDSGFRAKRESGVYDFCIASSGLFFPCQGRSMNHGLFQPVRETHFEHKGILIPAVQLRDDLYKEQLYLAKIKKQTGSGWYLPQNIGEAYKAQLTDEQLTHTKTEKGQKVLEWKSAKGNNHLGDVEKCLLAGIDVMLPILRAERDSRSAPKEVPDPKGPKVLDEAPRMPHDPWALPT
jgi:phage terminase large subunit GpA-like protein